MNISFFKKIYKLVSPYFLPFSVRVRFRFLYKHGYWPRINKPRSISEHIVRLMLNDRDEMRQFISDRMNVRKYVSNKSKECKLINLVFCGGEITPEQWLSLPEKFVMKANHGSQMVFFVDKKNTNLEYVNSLAAEWMGLSYEKTHGEWVYEKLHKKIICEEDISEDGVPPNDWKFFCSRGKVLYVQCDKGRFSEHRRNFYDSNYKKLDVELTYPSFDPGCKPKLFNKAVQIAEELSEDFSFIRVDLYIAANSIYFGELTNFPGAGLERYNPKSFDFEKGALIKL